MYALAPTSRANTSALAKSVSATATTLQEGFFLYESRCQRPICPHPTMPIRIDFSGSAFLTVAERAAPFLRLASLSDHPRWWDDGYDQQIGFPNRESLFL